MPRSGLDYLVVAPSYDVNSGGTIFLHELVHVLNSKGFKAALTPMLPYMQRGVRQKIKRTLKPAQYKINPELNTPVSGRREMKKSTIVVYTEMVLGNPVKANHVARWLLYTPGRKHPYSFTDGEMFFRVDEFADLPEVTGGATDLFLWKLNRAYRNEGRPNRSGACYMVRKWLGPLSSITDNAIKLDGKSHEEINDIFNDCEVFYCYDDATMYSQFAAICGCLSVVLPTGDQERDQVLSNHMMGRYGVAYGMDEEQLAHARSTMHLVRDLMLKREEEGVRTVDDFVRITQAKVNGRGHASLEI